eukprot:scaffold275_cov62-Phaeocystis_antarctica.AAC.2
MQPQLIPSSFPSTGGNSLHAVRCVSLLNTQLAANQVTNSYTSASVAVVKDELHYRVARLYYTMDAATLPGLPSRAKSLSSSNRRSPGQALASA